MTDEEPRRLSVLLSPAAILLWVLLLSLPLAMADASRAFADKLFTRQPQPFYEAYFADPPSVCARDSAPHGSGDKKTPPDLTFSIVLEAYGEPRSVAYELDSSATATTVDVTASIALVPDEPRTIEASLPRSTSGETTVAFRADDGDHRLTIRCPGRTS
jgi:hypothetical protein